MKTSTIQIRKSTIQGWGAFATSDFHAGESICIFQGKPLTIAAIKEVYLSGKRKRISADGLQIKEREYLRLDRRYNSVNHSCDPNAAMQGLRRLTAVKDIKKGTEITYDYSAVEWTPQDYTEYDHAEWPMHCNCGAASCRHLIGCFPYLPKSTQRKYVASGIIQDYILRKLKWPKTKQRCYVCEEVL